MANRFDKIVNESVINIDEELKKLYFFVDCIDRHIELLKCKKLDDIVKKELVCQETLRNAYIKKINNYNSLKNKPDDMKKDDINIYFIWKCIAAFCENNKIKCEQKSISTDQNFKTLNLSYINNKDLIYNILENEGDLNDFLKKIENKQDNKNSDAINKIKEGIEKQMHEKKGPLYMSYISPKDMVLNIKKEENLYNYLCQCITIFEDDILIEHLITNLFTHILLDDKTRKSKYNSIAFEIKMLHENEALIYLKYQ
jgi:hypothetical protein